MAIMRDIIFRCLKGPIGSPAVLLTELVIFQKTWLPRRGSSLTSEETDDDGAE
jgi:hypothetical protein